MVTTKSYVQWSLTYKGEPMLSPVFRDFEECASYIDRSENPDDYEVISRIVVEQCSEWAVWK